MAYYYNLSGFVYDKNNQPLPFVNIYVKQAEIGISTDIEGKYHFELSNGSYEIIFTIIGYEKRHINVTINGKDEVRNIYLSEDTQSIEEVEVVATRKDPAYEIIQNAIHNKNKYLKQFESSICNVYIKSGELGEEIKRKRERKNQKLTTEDSLRIDSIQKSEINLPQKSFVEVQLTRNWQYPNQIKEVVSAYDERGAKEYLYYLSTTEADFNFYENLLNINGLTETPIISPLSRTSILAYKFKFLETYREDDLLVHKIKVIPRAMGNVLFEGTIDIVEGTWNIKRLSLHLGKGQTNLFDEFTIEQNHTLINDSFWVISNQNFYYTTKTGKNEFKGKTKATFSNWQINPTFKKRFFSNELGVVTQDAYDKDSTFWDKIRPEPLTEEEQQFILYTDSIKEAHQSEAFLDSIQADANKITWRKILLEGLSYVNYKKEKRMYFSSIPGMANPFQVGGFRVGYWLSYFKKFKNKQTIYLYAYPNYGIRNKDLKGEINVFWRYNPFREGYLQVRVGREFDIINSYDAYINMLKRTNYYQNERFSVSNSIEIFNGFYTYASMNLAIRSSVAHYKTGSFTDGWFDDNSFQSFTLHNAFYTNVGFSYTPFQKYIRQPYEKVVLGSKYPTIGVNYKKAWEGILASPLNFNYLEFYIHQKMKLGVGGTSEFRFSSGKFLSRDSTTLVDYKYHRARDPILFTDPLSTYQVSGRNTFNTFDWFYEGHFIHHFNGALANKIPFIKKTQIRLVAGGSFLLAPEKNIRHIEVFGGAERVFKIARERFRIGIYQAFAQSNWNTELPVSFKVSFEYFNRQNQSWGF